MCNRILKILLGGFNSPLSPQTPHVYPGFEGAIHLCPLDCRGHRDQVVLGCLVKELGGFWISPQLVIIHPRLNRFDGKVKGFLVSLCQHLMTFEKSNSVVGKLGQERRDPLGQLHQPARRIGRHEHNRVECIHLSPDIRIRGHKVINPLFKVPHLFRVGVQSWVQLFINQISVELGLSNSIPSLVDKVKLSPQHIHMVG